MGKRIVDDWVFVEKLRSQGFTFRAIGETYGVSRQAIQQGLQEYKKHCYEREAHDKMYV